MHDGGGGGGLCGGGGGGCGYTNALGLSHSHFKEKSVVYKGLICLLCYYCVHAWGYNSTEQIIDSYTMLEQVNTVSF